MQWCMGRGDKVPCILNLDTSGWSMKVTMLQPLYPWVNILQYLLTGWVTQDFLPLSCSNSDLDLFLKSQNKNVFRKVESVTAEVVAQWTFPSLSVSFIFIYQSKKVIFWSLCSVLFWSGQVGNVSDYRNLYEANFLLALCHHLLLQSYNAQDIIILTTYPSQRDYLQQVSSACCLQMMAYRMTCCLPFWRLPAQVHVFWCNASPRNVRAHCWCKMCMSCWLKSSVARSAS